MENGNILEKEKLFLQRRKTEKEENICLWRRRKREIFVGGGEKIQRRKISLRRKIGLGGRVDGGVGGSIQGPHGSKKKTALLLIFNKTQSNFPKHFPNAPSHCFYLNVILWGF